MKKIIFLLCTFIFFQACASTPKKSLQEIIDEKPVYHLKNHTFNTNSSIESRCTKIPELILNNLQEIDQNEKYKHYQLNDEQRKILNNCIEKLPPVYKKVLKRRLIGIYFVENLLGSGWTDWIVDENNNVYSYIAMNPVQLKYNLSEWISIKENTCFIKDNPDYQIKVDCGTNQPGLLYIMLHELSHVIDYAENYTPYVEPNLKDYIKMKVKEKDFTKNIWKDYRLPIEKYNYKLRDKVTFYGFSKGPKIKISQSEEVYKQLSKTPFASLYSTKLWADDFAEYITFYHMTQKMGIPFKINIYNKDELIYSYEPMKSSLVQKRYKLMKEFYK